MLAPRGGLLGLGLAALLAAAPAIAQPAEQAEREISALITALGRSHCTFERNGRWHDAARAQAHLQRKYDAARQRAGAI
ncbi:MAG TPA: DUF5329 family protein, partial [Lysobacter sp.]